MARHTTAPPARVELTTADLDRAEANAKAGAVALLTPTEAPTPTVKPTIPTAKVKIPTRGPGVPTGPRPPRTPGKAAGGPATRSRAGKGDLLPAPVTTTGRAYHGLDSAYAYFNRVLFEGRLPEVVVTLQRHKGSYGYFSGGRFADTASDAGTLDTATGKIVPATVDEIAMNPTTFAGRPTRDVLSTLVHEMTHVEQHHFGKPSRNGYHNAEWGTLMDRIGLTPTDTGAEGGKRTGQSMTHMIVPGGPFDKACSAFFGLGGTVTLYGDRHQSADDKAKVKKKGASKTKYTCPCCEMNAWAKPDVRIVCGECEEELEAEVK